MLHSAFPETSLNQRRTYSGLDSVFAYNLLSFPAKLVFFRSLRSAVCNPERSHCIGMPQITIGGPERARKRSLGEREGRSCEHRIRVRLVPILYTTTLIAQNTLRSFTGQFFFLVCSKAMTTLPKISAYKVQTSSFEVLANF